MLAPAREYEIVLADAIKESVHIMRRNTFLDVIKSSDERSILHFLYAMHRKAEKMSCFMSTDIFTVNRKSLIVVFEKQATALNMYSSEFLIKLEAANMSWRL